MRKVKQLVWRVPTDHPDDPDIDEYVCCADGADGVYAISREQANGPKHLLWASDEMLPGHASIDEAKAAAQAHYESYVLSLIEQDDTPRPMTSFLHTLSEEQRASALAYEGDDTVVPRATHRHKKRGTEYVLISYGKMQAEGWYTISLDGRVGASVDMREVAIYRSATDLTEIWVRPRDEFEDGRFEEIGADVGPLPRRLWETLRRQLEEEYRRATGLRDAVLVVEFEEIGK